MSDPKQIMNRARQGVTQAIEALEAAELADLEATLGREVSALLSDSLDLADLIHSRMTRPPRPSDPAHKTAPPRSGTKCRFCGREQ